MNGETERAERRRLRNDLLFAAQMLAFYRSIGAGEDAARAVGRDAYWAAINEHAGWNSRANFFRRAVEARLRECKDLIRERNVARSKEERVDLVSRINALEAAVDKLTGVLEASR